MFAGDDHQPLVYVRVVGDCMDPVLEPGHVLGVDPGRPPRDGDIVVARRGHEVLVKYLRTCGTIRWLVAAAPGLPVTALLPPVELVGVVSLVAREI